MLVGFSRADAVSARPSRRHNEASALGRVRSPRAYHRASAPAPMPALSLRLSRIALAGMVAWIALLFVPLGVAAGPAQEAMHLVLLAPLVLAPMFLDASLGAAFGTPPRVLTAASWALVPGMAGAAASVVAPTGGVAGALAAVWLVPTGLLALWALDRGLRQWRAGGLDAAEALGAAGWAMLPGGAVWLVLARGGVETGYGELVGVLTAAHFHYAGAFVAIWAGLLGRTLEPGRGFAALAAALVAGFWGVVVGIVLSRGPLGGSWVETAGVVVLAAAAAALGVVGVVRAGRFPDRKAGLMVAVSGGSLVLAMALALYFHVGARLGLRPPDFGWMVSRHGALNAYGFGLWGALGWRRLRPRAR